MPQVNLTKDEIEIIKQALENTYDSQLKVIKENAKILDDSSKKRILNYSNKVYDTLDVFNQD